MALENQLKDVMDSGPLIDNDPRVRALAAQIDVNLKKGRTIIAGKLLNDLINLVADLTVDPMVAILADEEFGRLDNKSKAVVVRDVFEPVVENKYYSAAKATGNVLSKELLLSGVIFSAANPIIDADRLGGATAGIIKQVIEGERDPAAIATGAYKQMIRLGRLDTILVTSQKIEENARRVVEARRYTTSKDPCDYCIRHTDSWFSVMNGNEPGWKFHDNCNCGIETRIVEFWR